jgi:hypothetical protein
VWQHVAVTYDNSNADFYLNGAADGTPAYSRGAPSDSGTDLFIGAGYEGGSDYWNGVIDEVRFSGSIRSANWILAEYDSVNAPGTSNVYGGVIAAPFRNRIMSVA